MKRLVSALLLCMVASQFGVLGGLAQEDASVPAGAVANDTRVYFKGGLENVEAVQFMMLTNWEMDSADAAERFFADLSVSVSADLAVGKTTEQLQERNDNQVLIVGEDQTGGAVSVVLFQQGTTVGTWMAVGDAGQDEILATLYNDFFENGFDAATPFPAGADLPEGYAQVGGEEQVDAAMLDRGLHSLLTLS
jgi:hypothetical protein